MNVEAANVQTKPWIIHAVVAEPGRPLTKSIAGPRAFSSMNMLRLLDTSLNIHRPLFISMKNIAKKSQKTAKVEIMTSMISPTRW